METLWKGVNEAQLAHLSVCVGVPIPLQEGLEEQLRRPDSIFTDLAKPEV